MPIDIDSDAWKEGKTNDAILVKINDLFRDHDQMALSIREIESHLLKEHSDLFPADLGGEDAVNGAKAARQSIITNILFNRYWKSEFTFRYVTSESDEEPGLYFADSGIGISPVAEIDQVKDPDPDSSLGTLEGRFRKIEKDVDGMSELENRISHIEFQLREKFDIW